MRPLLLIALLIFNGHSAFADMYSGTPRTINSWEVSCRVDNGAITKRRKVYTFTESRNHCPGGTYSQRSEIKSKPISPKVRARYMFDTRVSFTSPSLQKFDIFQIHDGRNGCAPPLKVTWTSANTIKLNSAFTKGIGEAGCVSNRAIKNARYLSTRRLKRDGTEYHLQVILNFDGKGNFDVVVLIDNERMITGSYVFDTNPTFQKSSKFYFKHGVYSKHYFDYRLVSTGMSMKRIR